MASSRVASLLALGGVLAVGALGWTFWSRFTEPPHFAPSPDDDLDLLVHLVDASAARAEDRLVAGPSGVIVSARGAEGDVALHVLGDDATARPLVRAGSPVTGLALRGDTLWLATDPGLRIAALDGGIAPGPQGLERVHALAAGERWVVVVTMDPPVGGLLHASSVVSIDPTSGDRHALGHSDGEIAGVAVAGDTAYWADRLEGTLVSAPAAGGAATILASERGLPEQPTVVGDELVWVEKRSESLWAVPRSGGASRRLAQDFAGFAHVVACGKRLAWTTESAVEGVFPVLEMALGDAEPTPVGTPTDGVDALACRDGEVLQMRDGKVGLVR